VEERIEIISAEWVIGMNMFRDMLAGIRDIFGGRSSASQKFCVIYAGFASQHCGVKSSSSAPMP
jgi:hypothetical protein